MKFNKGPKGFKFNERIQWTFLRADSTIQQVWIQGQQKCIELQDMCKLKLFQNVDIFYIRCPSGKLAHADCCSVFAFVAAVPSEICNTRAEFTQNTYELNTVSM